MLWPNNFLFCTRRKSGARPAAPCMGYPVGPTPQARGRLRRGPNASRSTTVRVTRIGSAKNILQKVLHFDRRCAEIISIEAKEDISVRFATKRGFARLRKGCGQEGRAPY